MNTSTEQLHTYLLTRGPLSLSELAAILEVDDEGRTKIHGDLLELYDKGLVMFDYENDLWMIR